MKRHIRNGLVLTSIIGIVASLFLNDVLFAISFIVALLSSVLIEPGP